MKQKLLILLIVNMLMISAAAKNCYVDDIGMEITLPETYTVCAELDYERDFNPVFMAIEEETETVFKIKNFSPAFSDDYEFDFRMCSDEEIEELTSFYHSNIEKSGGIRVANIETENAKYVKYHVYKAKNENDDKVLHSIVYKTFVDGFNFEVFVYSNISPEDDLISKEQEFDGIVKSICFDDTLKEMQVERKNRDMAEQALKEKRARTRDIIAICTIIPAIIISAILITYHMRKKAKNKMRDKKRQEQIARYCKSCGAAMAEDAEVCSSCGTRQ